MLETKDGSHKNTDCSQAVNCLEAENQDLAHYEEAYFDDISKLELFHPLKKASHLWGIGYWKSVYDLQEDTAVAVENVVEIRKEQLTILKTGDVLALARDPENGRRLLVCKKDGAVIGRLHWTNCAAIIPMLEDGTMKSLEVRVHDCNEASLEVELKASFRDLIRCTLYRVECSGAMEELCVQRCVMELDAVKALFELYSQYRDCEKGYFGTYVCNAVQQEPLRYSMLAMYEIDEYAHLEEILEQHSLPEEYYYRVEGIPVSEEEYQKQPSGSNRQKALALFAGKKRMAHLCAEQILASDELVSLIEWI